MIPLREI